MSLAVFFVCIPSVFDVLVSAKIGESGFSFFIVNSCKLRKRNPKRFPTVPKRNGNMCP